MSMVEEDGRELEVHAYPHYNAIILYCHYSIHCPCSFLSNRSAWVEDLMCGMEFYMFLKMNMDRLLLYFPLPDIQQVFVGVLEVCTSSNTHY